jgi:Clostripain family
MTRPLANLAALALALAIFSAIACEPSVTIDKPTPSLTENNELPVRRPPPGDWIADWTLLIYAANDDLDPNLVAAFDADALEWQHGLGGSALFQILVQRDFAPFQVDDEGAPRESERYSIYREERYDPEYPAGSAAPEAMLLGETDTTSSTTLRDFLVYGIRRFPARHYWITFTGHGDGFAGLAHDASAEPGERLSIAGLSAALSEAASVIATEIRSKEGYGGPGTSNRIDVVSFDACRLGTVEVATSIAEAADFMIASREAMPQSGHPYSALRYIAQDEPDAEPRKLVEAVVTDYVRAYVEGVSTAGRAYVGTSITSVGLDLRRIGELEQSLGDLASVVEKDHPGGFSCAEVLSLLDEACAAASVDAPANAAPAQRTNSTPAAAASVDLVALLNHLSHGPSCGKTVPVGAVAKAAKSVLDLIGYPRGTDIFEYGGQYQKITDFGATSPFVVQAQRLDPQTGIHLGGLSILWGNPYDLLYKKKGRSVFDIYRALPFEARTGWTRMFAACITQAEACRSYEPPPDEPISAGPCANF